jgi:hypothetical protein
LRCWSWWGRWRGPAPGARAFDESKYPDFSGQWRRPPGIGIQCDQTKPLGRGQQAPLTPEYQKVFEGSLADQAAGVLILSRLNTYSFPA